MVGKNETMQVNLYNGHKTVVGWLESDPKTEISGEVPTSQTVFHFSSSQRCLLF